MFISKQLPNCFTKRLYYLIVPKQYTRVPVAPHSYQLLLLSGFLLFCFVLFYPSNRHVVITIVVLIGISLVINNGASFLVLVFHPHIHLVKCSLLLTIF